MRMTPHNPLPPLVRGIKGDKEGRACPDNSGGVVGSLRSPTTLSYGLRITYYVLRFIKPFPSEKVVLLRKLSNGGNRHY
jgi:hypothetical protein